jgi:dTDP-4-dehydrorhamnose reductase
MILITGAKGQLGRDLRRVLEERNIPCLTAGRGELDVTDIDAVRRFIAGNAIEVLIHCAAYNKVDRAETEQEECFKLNAFVPRDLALVAKEAGAVFVTYSTDFVFDGLKGSPYTEEDAPNPLSVYGRAKEEGEKLVLATYDKSYVIRTSWMFGIHGDNFCKKLINWSRDREILSIVDDQISAPTYAYDLARYTMELLKTEKYGLYHISNAGEASKYDEAKYVLDKIGWNGELQRAKSCDFTLQARRAPYTKLDSTKLEKTIGQKLPPWQSAIDRFLAEFLATAPGRTNMSNNIVKAYYRSKI